jgi:hypothetical protein
MHRWNIEHHPYQLYKQVGLQHFKSIKRIRWISTTLCQLMSFSSHTDKNRNIETNLNVIDRNNVESKNVENTNIVNKNIEQEKNVNQNSSSAKISSSQHIPRHNVQIRISIITIKFSLLFSYITIGHFMFTTF